MGDFNYQPHSVSWSAFLSDCNLVDNLLDDDNAHNMRYKIFRFEGNILFYHLFLSNHFNKELSNTEYL